MIIGLWLLRKCLVKRLLHEVLPPVILAVVSQMVLSRVKCEKRLNLRREEESTIVVMRRTNIARALCGSQTEPAYEALQPNSMDS